MEQRLIMDVDILREMNFFKNNKKFIVESQLDFVKDLIDRYKLKTRCRKREYIYNRYVVFNYLKSYQVPLEMIGSLFEMNHTTVVNGLKVYNDLTATKDYTFHLLTAEISSELNKIR